MSFFPPNAQYLKLKMLTLSHSIKTRIDITLMCETNLNFQDLRLPQNEYSVAVLHPYVNVKNQAFLVFKSQKCRRLCSEGASRAF